MDDDVIFFVFPGELSMALHFSEDEAPYVLDKDFVANNLNAIERDSVYLL